jgi:hypothetical protein
MQVPGFIVMVGVVFGVTDVLTPLSVTETGLQPGGMVTVVVVEVVEVVVVGVVGGLKETAPVAVCPLLSMNSKAQVTPSISWDGVGGQG